MQENRTIKTERLILRPLMINDADALYPIYSNLEAMRYWDTLPHAHVADTQSMINKLVHDKACWWTIYLRDDNHVIGNVGYLGNAGVPGMGYILHPAYWQQGYMTEAVRAALAYGFDNLGLDRVELWIDAANIASQTLAHKLGFTRRGRFRQKYRHHPTSHDTLVYGLHIHEWRQAITASQARQQHDQFYSLQPVLTVLDVKATAEYYRDQLEFTIDWLYGDPPTHGAVSRGEWTVEGAHLQLSQTADDITPCSSVTLYIFVGPDIDRLYERYRAHGVHIESKIASYPWGMREFTVKDCNGYRLCFGTPT